MTTGMCTKAQAPLNIMLGGLQGFGVHAAMEQALTNGRHCDATLRSLLFSHPPTTSVPAALCSASTHLHAPTSTPPHNAHIHGNITHILPLILLLPLLRQQGLQGVGVE